MVLFIVLSVDFIFAFLFQRSFDLIHSYAHDRGKLEFYDNYSLRSVYYIKLSSKYFNNNVVYIEHENHNYTYMNIVISNYVEVKKVSN